MEKDKEIAKLQKTIEEQNLSIEKQSSFIEDQNLSIEKQSLFIKEQNSRIEDDSVEIARWKNLYFTEKDRRYGRKSESSAIPNSIQHSLFDEIENTVEEDTEISDPTFNSKDENQKKTIIKTHSRTLAKRASLTLPSNSPVVDIYHEAKNTNCDICGAKLSEIGEFIEDKVTFVPSRYVIVRHHRKQQRCLNCLPLVGVNEIITSAMDNNLLVGTICEPSLLSYIIVHKMQFGLPLYRLEQKLVFPNKQKISRKLMSAWSITTYNKLKGLEAAFERNINNAALLNVDETSLINIHSDKKSKILLKYEKEILQIQENGVKQKIPDEDIISMVKEKQEEYQKESHNAMNCFMIVRSATNKDGNRGLVMYNYTEHRTNEYLENFIGDYKGVLQSDGLAGYANAAKNKSFTHLNCLLHSRRPAKDILRNSPNNKIAKELVNLYNDIFKSEKELREKFRNGNFNAEEYVKTRLEELGPKFDKLHNWLLEKENSSILSPSMKKAINYPLKRWESLKKFMDYSFADSQNNEAERRIKSFVLGRKAFLFSNTVLGANASAFYYSLVESCKALEIDPFNYITHVLLNAGSAQTDEQWDSFLPSRVDLSETKTYLEKINAAIPNPGKTDPYILRGKKKR